MIVVNGRGRKKALYMCMICGYVSRGIIPVKCPVCGADKRNFKRVSKLKLPKKK